MSESGNKWEIIVLGGGPAGLTAALYGSRAGHSVLVLEPAMYGGQIATTDWLENFPGIPEGITGPEYSEKVEQQARKFGAELRNASLEEVELTGAEKKIVTSEGEFKASKVIIASGTEPRKLGVEGEDLLQGRGISYCATCDAAFFRDKEVAVVGGGDSAVEEALFLTRFARAVYLIHRRDRLRAVQNLQDKLLTHPQVKVFWNTVVQEVQGDKKVEGLTLMQKDGSRDLPVNGVFVSIGREPNTVFLGNQVELNDNKFIITDEEMRTSTPGVFAAGDVREKLLRQVVTAASDGAIAAYVASRELQEL